MSEPGELISFLASRDSPCPACGYNLRGVQIDHCPECGATLDLRQLREAAEFTAWRANRLPKDLLVIAGMIGAIVGLAWPAGLILLFLRGWSYVSVVGTVFRGILIAAGLCHVALFWLFLWRTHWIAARPTTTCMSLALAAWLVGPIAALFVGLIAAFKLALV